MSVLSKRPRHLLLCFDAFGTLFTPRRPIAVQYGEVARRHGIDSFTDAELEKSFKTAFKKHAKQYPNYGKAVGMDASGWWDKLIIDTFSPFSDEQSTKAIVPELLERFSTRCGYSLYPDVKPFITSLHGYVSSDRSVARDWKSITIGVITNSDDRVPGILKSLGLNVSDSRYGQAPPARSPEFNTMPDIEFAVMSYDVGFEKPDRRIFEAAEQLFLDARGHITAEDLTKLYVGDDFEKDVMGARNARWESVWLNRKDGSAPVGNDLEIRKLGKPLWKVIVNLTATENIQT